MIGTSPDLYEYPFFAYSGLLVVFFPSFTAGKHWVLTVPSFTVIPPTILAGTSAICPCTGPPYNLNFHISCTSFFSLGLDFYLFHLHTYLSFFSWTWPLVEQHVAHLRMDPQGSDCFQGCCLILAHFQWVHIFVPGHVELQALNQR